MKKIMFALMVFALVLPQLVSAQVSETELWSELARGAERADDYVGNFAPGTACFMEALVRIRKDAQDPAASLQQLEGSRDTIRGVGQQYHLDLNRHLGQGWYEKLARGHKRAPIRTMPGIDQDGRLNPNGVSLTLIKMGLLF